MRLAAVALAGLWLSVSVCWAECRLGLVLALDVSGSVDAAEYRLQLDGIAEALQDEGVSRALLSDTGRPVALTVFEWSSQAYQRRILPWRTLRSAEDIADVANHLRRWDRMAAPEATGLGAALRQGASEFMLGPNCERQVIDVSADGKNNDWPDPDHVRREGSLSGITVNALVVISPEMSAREATGLVDYFKVRVLHGQGAFVERANGYSDYAAAMKRKLLREVSAPRIGSVEPDRATARSTRLSARR